MAEQLTFIHAADLHLGAPFRGLRSLSDRWANRLLSALTEAYDRVIEAAIVHKVDFVVVAGDIFDSAQPTYHDYRYFFEGLEKLNSANIAVYLITGNHDPFTSWKSSFFSFPENTTMLPADKPGFCMFERNNRPLCLIGGRGYYNQAWPAELCIAEGITRRAGEREIQERYPSVKQVPFAIGLLHTGLHLDYLKAPVEPRILLNAGMDYWALGHIHLRYVYPSLENPQLVFSGCVQGRDIRETGERSAYLVTLTQGFPNKIEVIPTASVVWQQLDVDISQCKTLSSITDVILKELFKLNGTARCEEMISRITLVGSTSLHYKLKNPQTLADIRKHLNDTYQSFFCDALLDSTTQPRDKNALKNEALFPAEFLKASQRLQENSDSEVRYLEDKFLEKGYQPPFDYERNISEMMTDAENLVLDLLFEEGKR